MAAPVDVVKQLACTIDFVVLLETCAAAFKPFPDST
jgi:hypothetical protein